MKFLNDVGSGEVTRIIDQKTALVQIDGGFEVPSLMKDLVVEKGSYTNETEMNEPEVEQAGNFAPSADVSPESSLLKDEEVLLAFLPQEDTSNFDTYIVNSSTYHFKYTISRFLSGEMILYNQGDIEPGLKMYLGSYAPGNMNDEEHFRVQGIFYNEGFYKHLPPVDLQFRLKTAELFNAREREESDYFLQPAILLTIHSWKEKQVEPEIKIDPEEIKKAMYTKGDKKPEPKKKKKPLAEEVDLHIQQLVDDHSSMDNAEILDIQLSTFRTRLESAILHRENRIVFIHGVGNGKLKLELRRILDSEYKQVRYQDASFKEYGYGATMVMLK